MRRTVSTALLLAVLTLCAAPPAPAKIIYVDDDAPAPGDGTSWATAYRFLQDALADGALAGEPVEIHVAQGTYKPDRSLFDPEGSGDIGRGFELYDDVSLLGGYAGWGAGDPNARNFELYEAILSGDLAGDDAEVTDAAFLYDDTTRTENTWEIVPVKGDRVLVEGFTVTGAQSSGVAIARETSDTIVRGCVFHGNRGSKGDANLPGGALTAYSDDFRVVRCSFVANAGDPGAIMCWDHACFEDCLFTNNYGWGLRGGAGQLWREGGAFTDCRFVGNRSAGSGGGLYVSGGECTLARCVFRGNVARKGGGGLDCSGRATVADCLFVANEAVTGGGGMVQSGGFLRLSNCLFLGNQAGEEGGGVGKGSVGAAIWNCTFAGNRAPKGSFLYRAVQSGAIEINDCVISNGGDEIKNEGESDITLRYTNVIGGEAAIGDSSGLVVWGARNVSVDPCFVDPGYWDPNGTPDDPNDDFFVEGDYHLKSQAGRWDETSGRWVQDDVTSPCIDAGDPNTPVMHEPFPNGGVINMGAYGGTAQASKSHFGEPPCAAVAGDINGDCRVDIADVILLLDHWLETGAKADAGVR